MGRMNGSARLTHLRKSAAAGKCLWEDSFNCVRKQFCHAFHQQSVPRHRVAPGAVDTPCSGIIPTSKVAPKKSGAIGKPQDIAAAVCFLASDESRFINGTTLVVD